MSALCFTREATCLLCAGLGQGVLDVGEDGPAGNGGAAHAVDALGAVGLDDGGGQPLVVGVEELSSTRATILPLMEGS